MADLNFATTPLRPDAAPTAPPYPRLFRAHIAAGRDGVERTAFVEASCHHGAIRKIAAAIAAIEMRSPEEITERCYNVWSARELIDDGMSDDTELRLFETGWSGERVISFVENPLFMLADSGPLIRKWASIQPEVSNVD